MGGVMNYYDKNGIFIDENEIKVENKSIYLNQVSSQEINEEKPKLGCLYATLIPFVMLLFLGFLDTGAPEAAIVGILLLAIIFVVRKVSKSKYVLNITIQGTETVIYVSKDNQAVKELSNSLSNALLEKSSATSANSEQLPDSQNSEVEDTIINQEPDSNDAFDRFWAKLSTRNKIVLSTIFISIILALILIFDDGSGSSLENRMYRESDLLKKDWVDEKYGEPNSAYRFSKNHELSFGTPTWSSKGGWWLRGDSLLTIIYENHPYDTNRYIMISPNEFGYSSDSPSYFGIETPY
jgi:hypothetical protein